MTIVRALRWAGFIGMMTTVLLRMFVVHAPQTVFDVDPTIDPHPLAGFGLGMSLLIDVLALFFAMIAIAGEYLAGRGLILWMLVLALVPGVMVYVHGIFDIHNLRVGLPWFSAAVIAAVLAHLARDARFRAVATAVLLAAVVPLLIRAVGQVTWEHRQTIRAYESQRETFLQAHGWEPGSSSAQIYERRLRQPQPLGWFTTSNVFASVMLVGVIVFVGWSVRAWKARMDSGWTAMFALLALACAVALAFTGSKGAMAACGGGLVLLAVLSCRAVQNRPWLARALVIGFVLAALGGIVLRGQLPEDFGNDRSLLFRWHYLQAAKGMMVDHPWTGVGPDEFQSHYTLYRNPRNPEEVSSAHSVFVDWLATLGRTSIAWIVLTIVFLARSHACVPRAARLPVPEQASDARPNAWRDIGCAAAVCLTAGVIAMIVEWSALDGSTAFLRLTAVLAMVSVAALITRAAPLLLTSVGLTALAAASAALLAHGQIELTFTQPGTAAWCMCVIAVAANPLRRAARHLPSQRSIWLIVPLFVLTALFLFLQFSRAWFNGGGDDARLESAASVVVAGDAASQAGTARYEAAWILKSKTIHNYLVVEEAARQMRIAGALAEGDDRVQHLRTAVEWADEVFEEQGRTSSIALLVNCRRALAHETNDPADWDSAIEAGRMLVNRDPKGLAAWKLYADVLWEARRFDVARDAYQVALHCNANFALDPLKQLADRDRTEVENRAK